MVYRVVKKSKPDTNNMIANDGLSEIPSPSTLIEGVTRPAYEDTSKLNFSDYVQTHETADEKNTNDPRTTDIITLYSFYIVR